MAVIGVAPWILFYSGTLETYPLVFHGRVMFHGFLMSFISGFLMTAVPKMSGTKACQPFDALAVLLLLLSQVLIGHEQIWSSLVFFFHIAFLLFFVLRRIVRRQQNPPATFLFVPFGLFSALFGAALMALADQLPAEWSALGRLLVFQAFVLNLIIGLGSRLVPVLSRAPGALSPMQAGQNQGWRQHLPLLVLFNLSFLVEAFLDKGAGVFLRAAALSYGVFVNLRIAAPMKPVTVLGIALRASALFLFLPYYLILIFPAYEIHLLHFVFIGGLGLTTMMVAVRVVLAHGGAGFEKEMWSKGVIAAAALLISASLLRSLAPLFFASQTFSIFAVAASLWLCGILSWYLTLGRHLKNPLGVLMASNKE